MPDAHISRLSGNADSISSIADSLSGTLSAEDRMSPGSPETLGGGGDVRSAPGAADLWTRRCTGEAMAGASPF